MFDNIMWIWKMMPWERCKGLSHIKKVFCTHTKLEQSQSHATRIGTKTVFTVKLYHGTVCMDILVNLILDKKIGGAVFVVVVGHPRTQLTGLVAKNPS